MDQTQCESMRDTVSRGWRGRWLGRIWPGSPRPRQYAASGWARVVAALALHCIAAFVPVVSPYGHVIVTTIMIAMGAAAMGAAAGGRDRGQPDRRVGDRAGWAGGWVCCRSRWLPAGPAAARRRAGCTAAGRAISGAGCSGGTVGRRRGREPAKWGRAGAGERRSRWGWWGCLDRAASKQGVLWCDTGHHCRKSVLLGAHPLHTGGLPRLYSAATAALQLAHLDGLAAQVLASDLGASPSAAGMLSSTMG